ncbi:MAG: hypothetical protein IPI65_02600 [Bacteroidetes bacterium]|nr:hypothetical protein [Bacteroidota bacterium]
MGTWGTGIKENDTSSDIYAEFFNYYNDGLKSEQISKNIIAANSDLINDPEEFTNFWLALALAQWETVSLDKMVFEKVIHIVETGIDLNIWRGLKGEENDIKKRKIVLDKFLLKIKKPKAKPLAKRKPKNSKFNVGDCLSFKLLNGNFGGAIILAAEHKSKFGFNLIALTRINQNEKPEVIDFLRSEVLYINCPQTLGGAFVGWFPANGFRKSYNHLFELIGKVGVNATFDIEGKDENDINSMYCGDWIDLIETANKQFDHEKKSKKATKTLTIKKLIKYS